MTISLKKLLNGTKNKMYKGKIGVALIAYNRPHYFSQLVNSLENQSQLTNLDFHLFLDGPQRPVADSLLIKQTRQIFDDSSLPNKSVHKRDKNVSIAINQFEAVEYMVNEYDYVWVVEDDLVLSKYYVRLLRIMIEQYANKKDVFGVSLNFLRRCNESDINKFYSSVQYRNEHWWAECFSSEKWKTVKPYFLEYYKFVKDIPYNMRPRERIQRLFKSIDMHIPQTSQDAGKDYALKKAGLKRINTVVNRGIYLGEKGVHFTPQIAAKYKFKEQIPYEFKKDANLKKFKLIA